MSTPKSTAQEQYFQLKLTRAIKRKEFWKEVRGGAAFAGLVILGVAAFVILAFSLCGGFIYLQEEYGLKARIKALEQRAPTTVLVSGAPGTTNWSNITWMTNQ